MVGKMEGIAAALLDRTGRIVDATVADLGPDTDRDPIVPVVERLLATVAEGSRMRASTTERLRADGAEAARAGRPLAAAIDAWLSAAWVTWEVALEIGRAHV